jgi:hypothetical protein
MEERSPVRASWTVSVSLFSPLAADLLNLLLLASPLAHLDVGPTRLDLEYYTGLVTAGLLRSTEEGDGRFSEPDDLGGRYPWESRGESMCSSILAHFYSLSTPFHAILKSTNSPD